MSEERERLRALLYETLRGRPRPLLLGEGFGIPAASLWSGARLWVSALRETGLGEGDRVVVALPASPAHVMLTVAAWWEGLTVCPAPAGARESDLPGIFGASLLVADSAARAGLVPGRDGEPLRGNGVCSKPRGEPSPDVAVRTVRGRAGEFADLLWGALVERLEADARGEPEDPAEMGRTAVPGNWDGPDLLGVVWPALMRGDLVVVGNVRGLRSAA